MITKTPRLRAPLHPTLNSPSPSRTEQQPLIKRLVDLEPDICVTVSDTNACISPCLTPRSPNNASICTRVTRAARSSFQYTLIGLLSNLPSGSGITPQLSTRKKHDLQRDCKTLWSPCPCMSTCCTTLYNTMSRGLNRLISPLQTRLLGCFMTLKPGDLTPIKLDQEFFNIFSDRIL